jgi:hypothetical protein
VALAAAGGACVRLSHLYTCLQNIAIYGPTELQHVTGLVYLLVSRRCVTALLVSACESRNSLVGIVTRQGIGRSGVRIQVGARGFSLLQNVQTGSGLYPASCVVRSR